MSKPKHHISWWRRIVTRQHSTVSMLSARIGAERAERNCSAADAPTERLPIFEPVTDKLPVVANGALSWAEWGTDPTEPMVRVGRSDIGAVA